MNGDMYIMLLPSLFFSLCNGAGCCSCQRHIAIYWLFYFIFLSLSHVCFVFFCLPLCFYLHTSILPDIQFLILTYFFLYFLSLYSPLSKLHFLLYGFLENLIVISLRCRPRTITLYMVLWYSIAVSLSILERREDSIGEQGEIPMRWKEMQQWCWDDDEDTFYEWCHWFGSKIRLCLTIEGIVGLFFLSTKM